MFVFFAWSMIFCAFLWFTFFFWFEKIIPLWKWLWVEPHLFWDMAPPWCQFCGQFCMHFGVKIEIYYIKWLCVHYLCACIRIQKVFAFCPAQIVLRHKNFSQSSAKLFRCMAPENASCFARTPKFSKLCQRFVALRCTTFIILLHF